MTIEECPTCGGKHQGMVARPYAKPPFPLSHWYICPATGDPVGVSVRMGKTGISQDDMKAIAWLREAWEGGSWLLWISRMVDGRCINSRMTHEFPHGFFEAVIEDFALNLRAEFGPPKPAEPMKPAPELKPLVSLFGEAGGQSS